MTTMTTSTPVPRRRLPPEPGVRLRHGGDISEQAPWRMAVADTATVCSGLISFGLVLGITVAILGRDALAAVFGAASVYGGSAQLTTATLLSHGSAPALAVLSGLVVN